MAAMLLGGASLAAAPEASAGSRIVITIDGCAATNITIPDYYQVDIDYGAGCLPNMIGYWYSVPANYAPPNPPDNLLAFTSGPFNGGSQLVNVESDGPTSAYFTFFTTNGTCTFVQHVISAEFTGPVPAASGCVDSNPIPDWVQGYGRGAASDVCLDGWLPSWEMWMNKGTGGFVCQRRIPALG
jgi:hypothetical protein